MPRTLPVSRKLAFAFLAASAFFLLAEGALSLVRAVRSTARVQVMEEQKHTAYDEGLGWVNLADFHSESFYGPGAAYTTNSQGFRSTTGDYGTANAPDSYRIICLGDSFTMGYGVDDRDTFPSRLAQIVPGSEVINMGMGGYGIGQDYLWYLRERERLPADLLLFAFIPNDFQRLAAKEFLGYAKPRVRLVDGALVTENVPVPRIFNRRLFGARVARFTDELALASLLKRVLGFAIPEPEFVPVPASDYAPTAAAIFDELAAISRRAGQDFALVLLATHWEQQSELTRFLDDYAERSGVPLIDVAAAFSARSDRERRTLFREGDGHFTAEGNRLAARVIAERARALFPRFPAVASEAEAEGVE